MTNRPPELHAQRCTDCDYCGEIRICTEHHGGKICRACLQAHAAEDAEPRRPTPSAWGPAVQLFLGDQPAGQYDSPQLWLAREWAATLAHEEPGTIVWLFEDGTLADTYRYDQEAGLERGVAR